jgi:RNA polymerase sigma-70 factor (ECF subfamily)
MGEHVAPTDADAVRRVLAGDVEAYRFLVERYRLEFGRLAEALVGDPDAAADALQEAFIRAYRSLGRCRDPDRFRRWFYRIVVNHCHDARRRRPAVSLEGLELSARETADAGLEEDELARRLERALEALTPEQREVFVLKEIEDRSYAEIAELLGTTVEALRMRVHRSRDVLRKLLEDER